MIYEKDEMSTIGGDWDNESSQQQSTSIITKEEGSLMGDLDEEDIAADQQKYYEENALEVEGFKCPMEFLNIITPMEIEEIVNLFLKFDTDKSNSIDKHETKNILTLLWEIYGDLQPSTNKALTLLSNVSYELKEYE